MSTHKRAWVVHVSSHVDASVDEVWRRIGTMEGVNAELGPWLSMTIPDDAQGFRIEDAPLGDVSFQSWICLGGLIPIDRHALRLVKVSPPYGFVEESTSWVQASWAHERALHLEEKGCKVVDTVRFTPRVGALGPFLVRVVQLLFQHRHRRLCAHFREGTTR